MSKWAKVTLSVLALLLVLVGVLWMNRVELMLKGVEIMSARRMSVGPNRHPSPGIPVQIPALARQASVRPTSS